MEYCEDYAELCAFENIRHTPAWYYKRFPGFFNVECYRILANWDQGIRDSEEEQDSLQFQMEDIDEGVEESKDNMEEEDENKKRKRMSEDLEIDDL